MIVTVCYTYLGPMTAEAVQNPPLKTVLKLHGIKRPNLLLGRGNTNEVCMNPKCLFPTPAA